MARPQTVSDAQILDGAARVIGRLGPAGFTLRDVGDEAGLSPAAILQRFHTKRGLLVALVVYATETVDHWFDAATQRHPRALDALVAGLTERLEAHTRSGDPAHHLAFLQLDLSDADLRRHTRALFAAIRTHIERLLDRAVQEGALEPLDTADLARAIEAIYQGTLLVWTFEPRMGAAASLRRSLGLLLGPRT